MKTTQITFYKVGLNETNFAYNAASFFNILNAGFLGVVDLTAPLAFGQPFNISTDDFFNYRNATYIRITNIYDNNEFEDRHAFINNFLELANGNFAVSYELDDWANFYLSGKYPNIEFDGFTERANVPLLKNGKIDLTLAAENEREKHNDVIKYDELNYENLDGEILPSGFICRVYFLGSSKFDGNPSTLIATGDIQDFDAKSENIRYFDRLTSNMVFMVFKPNKNNVTTVVNEGTVNNYTLIQTGGYFRLDDSVSDNVNKYLDFNFIPVKYNDGVKLPIFLQNVQIGDNYYDYAIRVPGIATDPVISEDVAKNQMLDIHYGGAANQYSHGIRVPIFAPLVRFSITTTELLQDKEFDKKNNYADYLENSLYKATSEAVQIKIIYRQSEIVLPANEITGETYFVAGVSGDGETVFVKPVNLKNQKSANALAATAQNTNIGDVAISIDYRSYKNAKITGTASVIASTAGAVVGLASSVATGNVAGVVGSLSGGAQGLIAGQQRLQGLTPVRQNGSAGDITITEITDGYKIFATFTRTGGAQGKAEIKQLERNGVATTIDFAEYLRTCQMQAYNAVKCAYMDIHNIPQQAARRISETLVAGVTLWTAVDVGNKDVINYQLETEG